MKDQDRIISEQFIAVEPAQSARAITQSGNRIRSSDALPGALHLHHEADAIDERVENYIKRNSSLLSRIFPTAMDQQRNRVALALDHMAGQRLQGILEIATQARLQEISERFDSWLRTIKIDSRQRFTSFVMTKLQNLRADVDRHRDALYAHFTKRLADLDRMQHIPKHSLERIQRDIDSEFDRELSFLARRLEEFEELASAELIRMPRFDGGG
jgi:hypothetical protein